MQHDIYADLPEVPVLCAVHGAAAFVLPALFLFTFGIYVHMGVVTEWIQWTAYIWPTGLLFFGMHFTVPNRAHRLRSSIAIAVYGTLICPLMLALPLLGLVGLRPFLSQTVPHLLGPKLAYIDLWWITVICLVIALLIAMSYLTFVVKSYRKRKVHSAIILTVSFAAIAIAALASLTATSRICDFDFPVVPVELYRTSLKFGATLILAVWAVTGAIVGTLLSRVQNEEVVLQEELAKAD